MFNLFKKQPDQNFETVNLKISGMHCSSCATNIDLTLEDLEGVKNADTNYQKSTLSVSFDPLKVQIETIMSEVGKLGYSVVLG